MQLAQRAVRGVMWAYTTFFGGKLITLFVTAILARLLGVEDFGLWGIALLVLSYVEATQDFGINDALIYNKEKEEETATTAFWLNLAIGFGQFALVYFLAPLAQFIPNTGAESVSAAEVIPIIRVIGVIFIINALGNTHDGLLQKNLEFRKRYMPEFYSAVIKGVLTIALALWLQNIWALVIGQLIGGFVRTGARWMLMPFRPKFTFYMDRARALWGFGIHVVGFNVFSSALDQADQTAITALIGVVQIGYFTIAARIPEMVISNFSLVLTRVLFPVFAKLGEDRKALTEAFLSTTRYTVLVTIPLGLGMVAVAPELVLVFFGEQWIPAIGLFQVLATLQMMFTIPWSAGDMFKAAGRPGLNTRLLFFEAIYTFPLIIGAAFMFREAFWASSANVVAAMITAFVRLTIAARFLNFKPSCYIEVFRTAFIAGLVMVVAVLGVRYMTSPLPLFVTSSAAGLELALHTPLVQMPHWMTLIVSVLTGLVVYAPLLWLLDRDSVTDSIGILRGALSSDDDDDEDDEEDTTTTEEPADATATAPMQS